MQVKNNPAGRLVDVLLAARKQPHKEPARKAWATAFGVDPADNASLLRMLAELINLVAETKDAIKRVDDVDHALHVGALEKVEKMLSILNLDQAWEPQRSHLDDVTIFSLRHTADKLSRVNGSSNLDESILATLRKQADELTELTLKAELPGEIKRLILANLESIRYALIAYRLRGAAGLEVEFERAVGAIALRYQTIEATLAKKNPTALDILKKFWSIVAGLNTAMTFGRNAGALGGPAVDAIENLLGK